MVTGRGDGTILIWDVPARRRSHQSPKRESLEALWTALAGEPRKAHAAVCALTEAPAEAVSFLAPRLTPAPAIDAKTREAKAALQRLIYTK